RANYGFASNPWWAEECHADQPETLPTGTHPRGRAHRVDACLPYFPALAAHEGGKGGGGVRPLKNHHRKGQFNYWLLLRCGLATSRSRLHEKRKNQKRVRRKAGSRRHMFQGSGLTAEERSQADGHPRGSQGNFRARHGVAEKVCQAPRAHTATICS